MRLLFITQKVDHYDAVLGFLPVWLRELAVRVEWLSVVTFEAGDPPPMPANVEIRSLGRERGASGLSLLLKFRAEMRRAVREHRCDSALAHMVPKYAWLARKFGVPRRVPIHLWYTHAGINRWLRWCEPHVGLIFTASEESLRLPTSKKVVTNHGIDISFLTPGTEFEEIPGKLITIGRLTPGKDVETLIRGTAALRNSGLDVSLDIVGGAMAEGDDAYGAAMRALAQELKIEDRVAFLGFKPWREIPPVYRRAQLFISASRTGSVDKAVLEAMACGVCVLTSNESFRAILPPSYQFEQRQVSEFVEKARAILSLDAATRRKEGRALRAIVERDHAVSPLMARLVREMEQFKQS